MGPNEDVAPPYGAAQADPPQPSEDLEHWLRDLRIEVVANPSDWAAAADHPTDEGPGRVGPTRAGGGGRHRAAD